MKDQANQGMNFSAHIPLLPTFSATVMKNRMKTVTSTCFQLHGTSHKAAVISRTNLYPLRTRVIIHHSTVRYLNYINPSAVEYPDKTFWLVTLFKGLTQ